MNLARALADALALMRLPIPEDRQQSLLAYLAMLGKWNKTYNLTAIHEPQRMLTHHLLDSLAVLPHVDTDRLLDVGSGAGLPGLPLAMVRDDLQVTLIDASQKKCAFMRQAGIELKIGNMQVVHARVEELQPSEPYQRIISRAFSDLSDFVRVTRHLLAPGGRWLAMKGLSPSEELAGLKGARLTTDIDLNIPGLAANRHLIIMEAA